MGVLLISNKCALYGSSFKFTELPFIVLNKTFASKDTNVHDIRLVTCEELVWSFVMEGAEEEPVGVVDSCRDGFSPKLWCELNSLNIVLAISIIVRFFLSITPFC